LETAGIRYDRLDGTMKRDERTRAMDALKFDPGCEVLLVSLKAGGVGLNLTAAQRVYLMDPYWHVLLHLCSMSFSLTQHTFRNPAVENQAVDRIVSGRSLLRSLKFILQPSTGLAKLDLSRPSSL
jgi:SWI/SNF-related matrix-associated actin-dependent regulator of chromatin subfamily A3